MTLTLWLRFLHFAEFSECISWFRSIFTPKWNRTCKLEAVHSSWTIHTQFQTTFLSHLLFGGAWWKLELTQKKTIFQNVVQPVRFVFQWFESALERKKMWLKRHFHFWERRIQRMHFLLDLILWHSVEEVRTIILIPNCLILAAILFQFIFASFVICKATLSSDKRTRKCSPLFEFSRIIVYEIYIELVQFWCKIVLFLLPKSWISLVLLPRSSKIL